MMTIFPVIRMPPKTNRGCVLPADVAPRVMRKQTPRHVIHLTVPTGFNWIELRGGKTWRVKSKRTDRGRRIPFYASRITRTLSQDNLHLIRTPFYDPCVA